MLARLTDGGEGSGIVCAPGDDEVISTVIRWRRNGWPAIVRRENREQRRNGLVPLGIPLPPSEGKRRLSFWAEREAIASFDPPPLLRATLASAAPGWRSWLERVAGSFSRQGFEASVYGALLWQHLTGMEYIGKGSDLDLLCTVAQAGDFMFAVNAFQAAQESTPVLLDGEIYLPGLGWAAWRELAQNENRVILIKHDEGELLVDRQFAFGPVAPH
jgi:phosphoribosyl-dephospho-CoA transferase